MPAPEPTAATVSVIVMAPIDRPLDYAAIPELEPGAVVMVPLGRRQVVGVVWGPGSGRLTADRLKPVTARLDVAPLDPAMRRFLSRAAAYTLTPLARMVALALRLPGLGRPPAVRRLLIATGQRPPRLTPARARVLAAAESGGPQTPAALAAAAGVSGGVVRGLVAEGALAAIAATRDTPLPRLDPHRPGAPLSPDQAAAAQRLIAAVRARSHATTLLRGVTGSGKTEVYLEAVAACLASGRQALVLMPEIALTAAFLDRVEARFGARPAEWHSAAAPADRRRAWHGAADGSAGLVVGARSALFLPFRDLGLIVIDEEHDPAYKQEEGTLYNARDMGVLRGAIAGCPVVLASATPSLETWVNAATGKYARLDLTERFGPAALPAMAAVDLRADPPERGQFIAPATARAVDACLGAGEQALLFVNRRGYAPLTVCRACGHRIACDQCDARLVEHRLIGRLVCHQCGQTRPMPTACPACGAADRLAPVGPGVERLAEEAATRWPAARIAILSSDMGGTATLRARIDAVAAGEADLVIGTQIVAKGHNFPLLTLVAVIDADLGLEGGDLRAAERSFQLIGQVAGRAGRADRPGRALIQTHQPDHPVIRAILSGDAEAFLTAEAAARRQTGMPPFSRLAGVILSGTAEADVWQTGQALALAGTPLTAIGAEIWGPAPAPIARIRGRHRVRLLVRAPKGAPLQDGLRRWRAGVSIPPGVRLTIDIDPQSFF